MNPTPIQILVQQHLKHVPKSSLACFEDTQLESAQNHANITEEQCVQFQHWTFKRAGLVTGELTNEIKEVQKQLFQIFLQETQQK